MTGDHLIVDKLVYAPHSAVLGKLLPYSQVKRGDIVVFRYPLDIRHDYVKRVIGVPGDRIHLENGVLVRNGEHVKEPYTQFISAGEDFYRDNFPSLPTGPVREPALVMLRDHVFGRDLIVPEGQYFVMGDNRNNSEDSRYWGFVPRENITGKPVIVFWSYDAPTEDLLDFNAHHFADLAQHFFTRTRWNRTFKTVRPD